VTVRRTIDDSSSITAQALRASCIAQQNPLYKQLTTAERFNNKQFTKTNTVQTATKTCRPMCKINYRAGNSALPSPRRLMRHGGVQWRLGGQTDDRSTDPVPPSHTHTVTPTTTIPSTLAKREGNNMVGRTVPDFNHTTLKANHSAVSKRTLNSSCQRIVSYSGTYCNCRLLTIDHRAET